MLPKTPEPALNPTRRRVYFERELGGRTRLLLYSFLKALDTGQIALSDARLLFGTNGPAISLANRGQRSFVPKPISGTRPPAEP
jgi:hypothetical protein